MGVLRIPTEVFDRLTPASPDQAIAFFLYRRATWSKQDYYWPAGKRTIPLTRGDVFATYRFLSDALGFKIGTIRGALKRLQELGIIQGLIRKGVTIWKLLVLADADGEKAGRFLRKNKSGRGPETQTDTSSESLESVASGSAELGPVASRSADRAHESDRAIKSDPPSIPRPVKQIDQGDDEISEFVDAYNEIGKSASWRSARTPRQGSDRWNRLRAIIEGMDLEQWRSILTGAARSSWMLENVKSPGFGFFLNLDRLEEMGEGGYGVIIVSPEEEGQLEHRRKQAEDRRRADVKAARAREGSERLTKLRQAIEEAHSKRCIADVCAHIAGLPDGGRSAAAELSQELDGFFRRFFVREGWKSKGNRSSIIAFWKARGLTLPTLDEIAAEHGVALDVIQSETTVEEGIRQ